LPPFIVDDHDVFSFEVKQLFGGQDKNAPAPEEAHLSHEQQQQLDNVQQKVQEMREQQEKEQSGGSAKDENRGYSIEMVSFFFFSFKFIDIVAFFFIFFLLGSGVGQTGRNGCHADGALQATRRFRKSPC